MILKLIVDDQIFELNVPEALLAQAGAFFDQMDRDMDRGWQMSREWVEHPDRLQRCQIVTDKLLTALEKENHELGRLMAGYILSRLPNIDSVDADSGGEIQGTRFSFREPEATLPEAASTPGPATGKLDRMEALAQAGREVTQVFKVGRGYRFSVFDPATGSWNDSPAIGDAQEAEDLRQQAFKQRFDALAGQARD